VAADVVGADRLLLEVRQIAAAVSEARGLEGAMAEHDLLPRARRKRRHALLQQLRELDRPPLARDLERLQRALRRQLVSRAELVVRPVPRRPPLRTAATLPVVDVAGALI